MKSVSFCQLLALLAVGSSASTSSAFQMNFPRPIGVASKEIGQQTNHIADVARDIASASGMAVAAAMLMTAAVVGTPSSALAAGDDPTIFNHNYADPLHPLCERKIEVSQDGKTFHYSGTAVGPKGDTVLRGCTPQEIEQCGLRKGTFDGFILEGNRVSAGDGIHEGVWEPAFSAKTKLGYEDKDGIRWNDGNKWYVIDNKA